jgi:hypothetical protein
MHSTINLAVRIGSNQLKITVPRSTTITCGEFLNMVMKKCKLQNNSNMYALWENANGVERMLNLDEKLVVDRDSAQLIVRKYRPSELNLIRHMNNSSRSVKQYYKRIERKPDAINNMSPVNEPVIQAKNDAKIVKLCSMHQKDLNKRLSQHNINFLRYLYVKLKITNKYDVLVNENPSFVKQIGSCGSSRSTSRSDSGSSIGLVDCAEKLESCV